MQARDVRFDGWFFVAVTSTGIYCRPSCPSVMPRRDHVRFYPTSAAAQRGGFRACKRCRPDTAPGSPEWNRRGDVVGRAMRSITDGVVDRDGVAGLAGRLGYSARQLQRLLVTEVGAGPLELARAQRAETARILLETTDLKAQPGDPPAMVPERDIQASHVGWLNTQQPGCQLRFRRSANQGAQCARCQKRR